MVAGANLADRSPGDEAGDFQDVFFLDEVVFSVEEAHAGADAAQLLRGDADIVSIRSMRRMALRVLKPSFSRNFSIFEAA